jgi:O-antigen/teichoic acid export membrane protein
LALVRRAGVALVVQVAGAGLAYGLQVLLARLLGASHYGVYSYILVWVGFAALLAGLGLPAASVRFLPVYQASGDHARIAGFVQAASRLTFATGSASVLCGAVAAVGLHVVGNLAHPEGVLLGAVLVPALAGSMLYTEIARARGRVAIAFVPPMVVRPLLIGAIASVIFLLRGSLSSNGALAASLCAGCLLVATQYAVTRRLLGRGDYVAQPVFELREWCGVGLTLLAAGAFIITLLQVDIVIVAAFLGSRDAGVYAAASKTATLVSFVILAVNAAAAPQFASLWATRSIDELQRLVAQLAAVIFWPSLAIAVGLAALAVPVLSMFGPEFSKARWVLIALLAGQLINAGAGSVGYLLNVTGHHREAARALGLSACACIALAVVGVSTLGLFGAALGSMLGFTMWNGWLCWLVVRKLGIKPSILTASRVLRAQRDA